MDKLELQLLGTLDQIKSSRWRKEGTNSRLRSLVTVSQGHNVQKPEQIK